MRFNIYKNGIFVNTIVADISFLKETYNDAQYSYEIINERKEINVLDALQQENKLLKAQVQAASDRSDFLEDCIAEMATLVYNAEETT